MMVHCGKCKELFDYEEKWSCCLIPHQPICGDCEIRWDDSTALKLVTKLDDTMEHHELIQKLVNMWLLGDID